MGADVPPPPALAHLVVDAAASAGCPRTTSCATSHADVDPTRARVVHAAQQPVAMSVFGDVMGTPAWRSVRSWYLVATDDQAIAPDEERMFARRMGAETVEVASSHVPMVSHPEAVVALIEAAASATVGVPAAAGAPA